MLTNQHNKHKLGSPFTDISLEQSQCIMGDILSRIASINEWQCLSSDAMLCYERALSYYSHYKSRRHLEGVAKTLASMGQLHFTLNEFENALTCFHESLCLYKVQNDASNEIANILTFMANTKREIGLLSEALTYFSDALYHKVVLHGKSHIEVGFLHHNLGVVYCDLSDFPRALDHFEEALRIRRGTLNNVLLQLSPDSYADSYTNETIRLHETEVTESLKCIGKICEVTRDFENAFACFEVSSTSPLKKKE